MTARRPRRIRTEGTPGSDPHPPQELAAEDDPRAWGDTGGANDTDDRIRREVPPHHG